MSADDTYELWWIDGCPEDRGNKVAFKKTSNESWIWVTGDKVHLMIGEYGDTKKQPEKTYAASSGRYWWNKNLKILESRQFAKYHYLRDLGPTVEGEYELNLEPNPDSIAKIVGGKLVPRIDVNKKIIGGIEKIPDAKKCEWGTERVLLFPVNVLHPKDLNGNGVIERRDLYTFYFHDSEKSMTSGCIEIPGSDFFYKLRKIRDRMIKDKCKKMKIRVLVRYPGPEHCTKGFERPHDSESEC